MRAIITGRVCANLYRSFTPLFFLHNLGIGSSLPKQFLGPKLTGVWLWSIQKIGTPYLFVQPLKLATLNLVHNLGLRSSLPETTFMTIIVGTTYHVLCTT